MSYSYIFCDFIAEMSVNETEEVVGADNRVAFSIEGIALLHVGILGKDFKIFGQEGIIICETWDTKYVLYISTNVYH